MPRPEETFAREALDRLLEQQCGDLPRKWSDGPDPPDFLLELGGRTLGVEVTMVVRELNLGDGFKSKLGYTEPLRRFAQDLEKEARARGILKGTYCLTLQPVDDLAIIRVDMAREFLSYLEGTQFASKAAESQVLCRAGARWVIEKLHSDRDNLYLIRVEGAIWERELQEQIPRLLRDRLVAKAALPEKIGLPVVLLLVDDFHFTEPTIWLESLSATDSSPFEAVIRVFGEHEAQVLATTSKLFSVAVDESPHELKVETPSVYEVLQLNYSPPASSAWIGALHERVRNSSRADIRARYKSWRESGLAELELAITTRLAIVDRTEARLLGDLNRLQTEIDHSEKLEELIAEGYAYRSKDNGLLFDICAGVDSCFFQLRSLYTLAGRFAKLFSTEILGLQASEDVLIEAVETAGLSTDWIDPLHENHELFSLQTAPWIALQILDRHPLRCGLVIMKENLHSFVDSENFVLQQQLAETSTSVRQTTVAVRKWLLARIQDFENAASKSDG